MMEPDVRIKTNEQGFCDKHFSMMLKRKNRLGLALMLESHLAHVAKESKGFGAAKKIEKINQSCYICSRLEHNINVVFENAAWLYGADRAFEKKIENQSYFCMHHYHKFLEAGKHELNRKQFSDFEHVVTKVNETYLSELRDDVSWYCKKFDYRYDEEPWGNAKNAPERAIKFLTGSLTETE